MASITQELHGCSVTVDDVARLFSGDRSTEFHCWGVVQAVNGDGSYQVKLNDSGVTARCARCVEAVAGSRVLVLVMQNGQCVATAKVL